MKSPLNVRYHDELSRTVHTYDFNLSPLGFEASHQTLHRYYLL